MKHFVAVWTLMSVCSTAVAAGPTTIELGGLRKATATITEAEDAYLVEVSLIPVHCFDSGMNQRLSQEKARSYATEALVRHLSGSKRQSATITNAQITEAAVADARFVLVMRVPRKNVQLTKATDAKPSSKSLDVASRRSLLTAKDDYQETLKVVTKTLTEDLPMFNGKLADFYEAVSDAEELGVTRLTSLGKEIKTDRLLLTTEREELLRAVAVEEERFLSRLRKRVEEAEGNDKRDK